MLQPTLKKFVLIVLCCFIYSTSFALPKFTFNNKGLHFLTNNDQVYADFGVYGQLGNMIFQKNKHDLANSMYFNNVTTIVALHFDDFVFYQTAQWQEQNKLQYLSLSYNGSDWYTWSVGQILPDFGLENEDYTPYITFMQEGLPANTYSPNYTLGGQFGVNNQHLAATFSITGPQIAEHYHGHDPLSLNSRFIYSPVHRDRHVLHLGWSFWQQYPSGAKTFSLSTIPEVTPVTQATLVGTGVIQDVKSTAINDLELAYMRGSFNVQGEYFFSHTYRDNGQPDVKFSGAYLFAGYFLTGEAQKYSFPGGYLVGITKIHHPEYGALQLAARVSTLNLQDKDVQGGRETNTTVGVNWFLKSNIIAKFNYIHIWNQRPETGKNFQNNVYALGIVFDFT